MLFSLFMARDDKKQIGDSDWPIVKKNKIKIYRTSKSKQLG